MATRGRGFTSRATSGARWCSTCRSPSRRREAAGAVGSVPPPAGPARSPDAAGLARLVDALTARAASGLRRRPRRARAGRARGAVELGDACGALLATSAVAKGLFHGDPWSLDVSGGFASPLAAELIRDADLIVGWGCALNMWTTRHGRLIGPDATVVQVDHDPDALGAHRDDPLRRRRRRRPPTARAADQAQSAAHGVGLPQRASPGRDRSRRSAGATSPYDDRRRRERIDPRTLTIALDDMLPAERVVAVDSGNFMGYPSMFLSVPDERGFCFTQAFQSIGLGLATGDRRRAGPARTG